MATDFGTDISAVPDLDFTLKSGPAVLSEALLRRLTTPAGGLFYDADYGFDVRDLLNEGLDAAGVARAEMQIASECEKDERVATATASLVFSAATQTFQLTLSVETSAGPFQLVLAVSALTVDILRGPA